MSVLFREKKRGDEKTVILVDIENGSAAAALARLSPHHPPKLFGEMRKRIPLFKTHDARMLAREIEKAAQDTLIHTNEVAARIRAHDTIAPLGVPTRIMTFLHAPWAHVRFEDTGEPTVAAAEDILASLRTLHKGISGEIPVSFHSFSTATAPLLPAIYNVEETTLVCTVSGELTELLLIENNAIVGYATIPFGSRTIMRTLQTHAGISPAEAHSLLLLSEHKELEALRASADHLAREFIDTAGELLRERAPAHVFVIAHEPVAPWIARSLAGDTMGHLFSDGGMIRPVRSKHVMPHIAAHASVPDVPLMLAALFADARFSSI